MLYGAASSVAMVLLVRANVGVEVSSMPALARAHIGAAGEKIVNAVLFLELFLASVSVQVSQWVLTQLNQQQQQRRRRATLGYVHS